MKFAPKRSAEKSQIAWRVWCSEHPELEVFAQKWAEHVESELRVQGGTASRRFDAMLREAGGASMRKSDLREVVLGLSDSWRHGESLRKWAKDKGILLDSD